MKRFELRIYNHQFCNRGVVERIRRKIVRSAAQGECILVDGEDVAGINADQLQYLLAGLDPSKVQVAGVPAHLLTAVREGLGGQ